MSTKINQHILVIHLLNYGFIYQSSEIYGGLSNSWDFGPLGTLLKKNLKNLWWDYFVTSQKNVVGLDSNIILNSQVWKASGHVDNFSDPLIDCKACKSRFRADKLIETFALEKDVPISINEQTPFDALEKIISDNCILCLKCNKNDWTKIRKFNLLFQTSSSVIEHQHNGLFLRPETAQGIFINFKNILRTTRMKLPFGVAQIGKAFRNEITAGNFIFRTKEFEQMEIEYFYNPKHEDKIFENFLSSISKFLKDEVGISDENLKMETYKKDEIAHYASKTVDFFYNFPHGPSELWGISARTDFDLKLHQNFSRHSMEYLDVFTNEKFIPHVIEPSVGVERLIYAILVDSYDEEELENEVRVVMKLKYELCPYKFCILPLSNKLKDEAQALYDDILKRKISAIYEETGSIGKRYRRQDAIGTKYCITFDFESLDDKSVTVRDRDTMKQKRLLISDILKNLHNFPTFWEQK